MAARVVPPIHAIPFPELDNAAWEAVEADASRYTAPTWVRAAPPRRTARAQRPMYVAPAAPAYAALVEALGVDENLLKPVLRWAQRATDRIVEAVRCHLGDVDAFICGSLATGTSAATTPPDIDVFLRAHAGRHGWDQQPDAALDDLARWLRSAVGGASLHRLGDCVVIASPGGLKVDVKMGWRTSAAPGLFVGADWTPEGAALIPFDPRTHSETLLARNALLRGDSAFLKLVRVIKHVNARWQSIVGAAPLTSFELESLALTICTEPFDLAEGLPFFFRRAAELVDSRKPSALGTAASAVANSELARRMLEDAAVRCEHALFATDAMTARAALGPMFALE